MHESAGTERQQQRIKVRKGKRCRNKKEHRGDKHTRRELARHKRNKNTALVTSSVTDRNIIGI